MMVLSWILGIVGVLGVGGAIAACIAAPAIAIPLLTKATDFLLRCKPCLVALAIGAAALGGWWYGHHAATAECREAEMAAELANREADLEAASKARSDETQRANAIAARARTREKDDADFIAHLKGRKACLFDDDDVGDDGVPDNTSRARRARPAAGAR